MKIVALILLQVDRPFSTVKKCELSSPEADYQHSVIVTGADYQHSLCSNEVLMRCNSGDVEGSIEGKCRKVDEAG